MDFDAICGFAAEADPARQTQALQYFEHLKGTEDGWRLCLNTLISGDQNNDHVKFFCLHILEDYIKTRYFDANVHDQQYVKEFVSQWFRLQASQPLAEKIFVRNKAAHVFCLAFLIDYPTRWPSFFQDLLQTLSLGPTAVDFYLRVLLAINSDVADREMLRTNKEMERSSLIKDTMRDQCILQLVDSWYHIITHYNVSDPSVVCLCLEVIGAYIAWIDIVLIANDKFVAVLVHFLSEPALREAACDCIHEIVNKGMEPIAKLKLVESFVSILDQAGILTLSEEENEDLMSKLAKLINCMGVSLIASWDKFLSSLELTLLKMEHLALSKLADVENTENLVKAVQNKVPLMLRFLSNDDDDVSQAMFEFAREYIQFLKQRTVNRVYSPLEKATGEEMLFIIINKYKYDDSYNFDHQGEDEALFDEYRKGLKVLYDNLAQLDGELVLLKTKDMITNTLQRWRTANFQDVEVAIHFLYLLGEALPASHGNHFVGDGRQPSALTELMKLLVSCGVSTYGHATVTLQYFETVARYEKFFLHEPHHIPEVLVAFMDERGLRNNSPRIRSRTSYLMSKFIKCLKAHIQSFTEDILKRLQDLLVLASPENGILTQGLLSQDDQLFLYEAAAILIISSQFETRKKNLLLNKLLIPVVEKFQTLLLQLNVAVDDEQRHVIAECMCHAMAVTSRTSKAFSNQQTMKTCGCVQLYLDALKIFLQSLEVNCEQVVLQSGVRQFLHRMVVCLEEEILPFIPVAADQLLKKTDIRSIQEFIPLINQIITKFKLSWLFQRDICPFLQRVFMPLVTAIFAALTQPLDENDLQAQRERQILQRSYFLFVAAIVTNVTEIIALQDMQGMEQVLLTVIQGAVEFPDPVAQKTCFTILKKMVELWGSNENGASGFVEFMYKSIVPACFLAPNKETFDLADAQTILALSECATCLKMILHKRGAEFLVYLQNQYLPTLNLSTERINEFCNALQADNKTFKNFFKVFFEKTRT